MYKEDMNIPQEFQHPEMEQVEKDFQQWYHEVMRCSPTPKSARYYQMFRAWKGSKEYYSSIPRNTKSDCVSLR